MFLTILKFLTTPFGKVIGIIGAVAFAALSLWGMVKIHDAGIRREALAKFNQRQMEVVIQSQKEFIAQTKRIEEIQKQITEDLKRKNEELDRKLSSIEEYLSSPEAQKSNRESSEILKETFKRLGK